MKRGIVNWTKWNIWKIKGFHHWFSPVRFFTALPVSPLAECFLSPSFHRNPNLTSFAQIRKPIGVFLFIEEHPDSINDGYFLNRDESYYWYDLPASYHHGSTDLSFADGHSERHRWQFRSTKPPPLPDAAKLPYNIPLPERGDFEWLLNRTSETPQ